MKEEEIFVLEFNEDEHNWLIKTIEHESGVAISILKKLKGWD